jgi:hypothetical protein
MAVVDRFIRTLRDMNTPTRYSKELSHHRKYRDFTEKRMAHLLEIYNNTKHETTKMTPTEMQDDREAETKYIIKKLYQVQRRKKISDFELKEGDWVRYIVPRDPMKKNRYKISKERYQVKCKGGNGYVIMDADGQTRTVARWRLLPYRGPMPDDPSALKVGRNFLAERKTGKGKKENKDKGGQGMYDYIDRAELSKTGKPQRYYIVWKSVDGFEPVKSWVTVRALRKGQTDMKQECRLEKDFWASDKGKKMRKKKK